jgi:hypothetical protein
MNTALPALLFFQICCGLSPFLPASLLPLSGYHASALWAVVIGAGVKPVDEPLR